MSENRTNWPLDSNALSESMLVKSVRAFLLDRESQGLSRKTITSYVFCLNRFLRWTEDNGITSPAAVTPQHLREWLVYLQGTDVADTTVHGLARVCKAYFNWMVLDGEINVSPWNRVRMPKVAKRIQPPYSADDIQALLSTCDRTNAVGARDYAIILTLLDSGLRASEFISLRVGSVDMRSGRITVMGKGNKQRDTRVGAKARGAINRMLAWRQNLTPDSAMWVSYHRDSRTITGELTDVGLRQRLKILGQKAGVSPCSPHRFRRTFALWCLRSGMDLHSLRHLMGHEDLQVLQRYLDLAGEDVERAHVQHSPVDKMM